MTEFERLLSEQIGPLERFVKYKIREKSDAEDIIQEVCISAYKGFSELQNKEAFKPWLLSIAGNKCKDYFRKRANYMEIPIDELAEYIPSNCKYGISEKIIVQDVVSRLENKDKQILYLYYWKEFSQEAIAARLNIPIGTVKSRLYYAKKNFKENYSSPEDVKGNNIMKTLPKTMPKYKISPIEEQPFPVIFEELDNWFIIPKLGEKCTWGSYDLPTGELTEISHLEVTNKVEIHGVEGVEIKGVFEDPNDNSKKTEPDHYYFAQLTDTHCRWLGESYIKNGVKHILTFLDGDDFYSEWGTGEDNCGTETHLQPKGKISGNANELTVEEIGKNRAIADIAGRFKVEILGKTYDTVRVFEYFAKDVATETYVDRNGKTVLWRRFNHNEWKYSKNPDGPKWTELLPNSERITINGETFVHWYDCISEYIL